jgi:hypothetical protein
MIDPDEISLVNKILYNVCALSFVIVLLDVFIWRP